MTVAAPPPLSALLNTLTTSLTSTATALPHLPPSSTTAGISLLDLKNDVFLSYLHHLSFLLLFRIRNGELTNTATAGTNAAIGEDVVKTLAALRIWLEKGVKPCENRLKYQVEKVLKAASEWERQQARKAQDSASDDGDSDGSGNDEEGDEGSDDSDDGEEGEDSDEEITSEEDEDLPATTNYDSDDLRPGTAKRAPTVTMKNALNFRPNPSSLAKPTSTALPPASAKSTTGKPGIYRPPKLNPVSMPTATTTTTADPDKPSKRRAEKSRALEEYLATTSSAPTAEPSIGSNVNRHGHAKTSRERAVDRERTEYEESNFVRLPAPTKKEKARSKAGRNEWGGEDWRGLGALTGGLDRIDRLTRRKGGKEELLEKSRKRGGEPEGDVEHGGRFGKRRRVAGRKMGR